MGELVVGKPALRLSFVVSLPIDIVSVMSLLYRSVPGNGLDPWLISMRRSLPREVRAELDLLHGFSGRMLYYMEEPVMRFDPLRPDRLDATFEELIAFLESLPASDYLDMVVNALGDGAGRGWAAGTPFTGGNGDAPCAPCGTAWPGSGAGNAPCARRSAA